MSGGAWEYVSAYVNNGNSSLSNASSLVNSYNSNGNKYVDVYPVGTSDSRDNNYAAWSSIKGDAVYETSSSSFSTTAWDGDLSNVPSSTSPFFLRGGNCNYSSDAGVFCFDSISGASTLSYGFRVVLGIK